jgi:hypothetical protein
METTMQSNPLSRLATSIPEAAAMATSVGGRFLGALLLVSIAFDQSYDRTQVFTPVIALIAVATCIPMNQRFAFWVAGLGSGLVFFAGTVLAHLNAGVGVLLAGLVAGLATAAWNAHRERTAWPTAVSFLAAAAPLGVIMLAILFTVKG